MPEEISSRTCDWSTGGQRKRNVSGPPSHWSVLGRPVGMDKDRTNTAKIVLAYVGDPS